MGTFKDDAEFGLHQVLSRLGINTGELYRAYDSRHGRHLALSIFSLKSDAGYLEKKRRDWEREADVARALDNHLNTAALYEFGT